MATERKKTKKADVGKKATKTPSKTQQKVTQKGISVKIGAFPGGKITSYDFPEGTTYEAGLKKANLYNGSAGQLDVRVNGNSTSSLDVPMNDQDQILVFAKVRGN